MGKAQKADHPWKKALSPRKAAQDREDRKYLASRAITSVTGNYPVSNQEKSSS